VAPQLGASLTVINYAPRVVNYAFIIKATVDMPNVINLSMAVIYERLAIS
jgi:hypothetical protein